MLAITPQDFNLIYPRMDRWVANRVRQCITAYRSPYPWAAALNVPPSPTDPPDFNDDSNQQFGRIPETLDDSGGSWPTDPAVPVGTSVPPSYAPTFDCLEDKPGAIQPDWSWWWWDTWREMVFYAVDEAWSPAPLVNLGLLLTGAPTPASQFIVAVAGRKLSSQQRINANDKADIANYLEDHNNPNFAATTPQVPLAISQRATNNL